MSIDKTIEQIKTFPDGEYLAGDFPCNGDFDNGLSVHRLKTLVAHAERLETALRQFLEKLDQRTEQYKDDDVKVSPLWLTGLRLKDEIKALRAALDSKGKERE